MITTAKETITISSWNWRLLHLSLACYKVLKASQTGGNSPVIVEFHLLNIPQKHRLKEKEE